MGGADAGLEIYQVDAFTSRVFGGNPAAVCLLEVPRSAEWMQAVALEMNLSETAFLVRRGDVFDLRWFTPAAEVDLCGHATLASAHVLWETGELAPEATASFDTRSGRLTAERAGEWIQMDFPADPPAPIVAPPAVVAALGLTPRAAAQSRLYLLVELEDEAEVRSLAPDFVSLRESVPTGLIATSPAASPEFDFVSRFFAPALGIDEDPVTGSAHSVLAPYWQERLGRTEMRAFQASARGGSLRVRCDGDRVKMLGRAVTVMKARWLAG